MSAKTKSAKHKAHPYLIGVLLVLFTSLAVVASDANMDGVEQRIFTWIYEAPADCRLVALVLTQLGSAWMFLGLSAFLFAARKDPRLSLVVLRNGALTYGSVWLAKFVIDRPRPVWLLEGVMPREAIVHGLGFPSGHTAMATVLALTLWPYVPGRLRWLLLAWIAAVGWSRMYLGVHSPLDVLGGAVLGALVVLGVQYLPPFRLVSARKR